ncbi:MAG: hypothetical protein GY858_08280 [Candidatus Omnitrophica bacterium]|nr:hypothetical protein [Candidatus Omnitrophota bacterium]
MGPDSPPEGRGVKPPVLARPWKLSVPSMFEEIEDGWAIGAPAQYNKPEKDSGAWSLTVVIKTTP